MENYGDTPLTKACTDGLTKMALELLKVDGLNFNIQDSDGWTALMEACLRGPTEVALVLEYTCSFSYLSSITYRTS